MLVSLNCTFKNISISLLALMQLGVGVPWLATIHTMVRMVAGRWPKCLVVGYRHGRTGRISFSGLHLNLFSVMSWTFLSALTSSLFSLFRLPLHFYRSNLTRRLVSCYVLLLIGPVLKQNHKIHVDILKSIGELTKVVMIFPVFLSGQVSRSLQTSPVYSCREFWHSPVYS